MSTPLKDEPEDRKDDASKKEGRAEKAPAEPASDPKRYVFKILPADPKNAFDFEDVADK